MSRQREERLRRLRELLAEVAAAFGFESADLIAYDRRALTNEARMVAMYVMQERCKEARVVEIGAVLGRDHSTVCHGIAAAEEAIAGSARLQHIVAGLLVEAPAAPAQARTIPVQRPPVRRPELFCLPPRRAQAA